MVNPKASPGTLRWEYTRDGTPVNSRATPWDIFTNQHVSRKRKETREHRGNHAQKKHRNGHLSNLECGEASMIPTRYFRQKIFFNLLIFRTCRTTPKSTLKRWQRPIEIRSVQSCLSAEVVHAFGLVSRLKKKLFLLWIDSLKRVVL